MWPRTRFHFQLSSLFFADLGANPNGLKHALLDEQSLAAVFGSLNFEETRNGDGKGGDGRHVKLIDNGNGGIDMQKGQNYSAGNYSVFDVIKPPCQCT
jgi:hypothetical protein